MLSLKFKNLFSHGSRLSPMDGNTAAAHVAYHMSESSFLYPITPSTPMGDVYDKWSTSGKKNVWDRVPIVHVLQSEAGAAGALHGAASIGSFTTTFTASQGLLLMIPNMHKTAGELWPTVFHVASRAVSTQALSIHGDHADVMCVKNTGFAMLSSSTVQEVMDLAAVSHMSTVDSEVPFIHFFEGFKLSHQIDSIYPLSYDIMKKLMPFDKLEQIRQRALNPTHPVALGHSQGPDSYFQTVELANKYYDAIPDIVQNNMNKLAKLTGRQYNLFDYYGHQDAEDVIVVMGAAAPVVIECMKCMKGEKVGVLVPHLYRPWSTEHFVSALPKSVKRLSVLDRSKDPAAEAEPLYMDVGFTINKHQLPIQVTGGRYGLASREFNPVHAKAVFDNMRSNSPKERFTVGIVDDVTNLSLPLPILEGFKCGDSTFSAIFWGLGGDGTIGANKAAISSAITEKNMHAQGNFSYSADKSNALTRSFLRFSNKPITAQYTIISANFIGCTLHSYISIYPMIDQLTDGGTFWLNCPWRSIEELEKNFPASLKKILAEKKAKIAVCDATMVANESGMRGKISTILQACFFELSGLFGNEWMSVTEKWIDKQFTRLGESVVAKNKKAARDGVNNMLIFTAPENWKNSVDSPGRHAPRNEISFMNEQTHNKPEFVSNVLEPSIRLKGSSLPVSAFKEMNGGITPVATTQWLKKGISSSVPHWEHTKCIQCNICSATCPHSCIRPFVLSDEEVNSLPQQIKDMNLLSAKNKEFKGLKYRIQVSPYDCVGCELCVHQCPVNCLSMKEIVSEKGVRYGIKENDSYIYLRDKIKQKTDLIKDKYNLKNSQFFTPMIEFPGSCEGCTETMATKIVTQLFGPRMLIANASGCSSVWGGASPRIPFTVDEIGRGPAWSRSLFEDNAEYGFGQAVGLESRRAYFKDDVDAFLANEELVSKNKDLSIVLKEWSNRWLDGDYTEHVYGKLSDLLNSINGDHELVRRIKHGRDLIMKPSQWIIGGDGWAYDIGYSGLDHIFSSGKNFNVLVFDNEVYSNTGGQQSKATNIGAIAQFASSGKTTIKKDLGFMLMNYGNVYIAQTSLANSKDIQHFIKCCKEAESFNGPSLILLYCNCILHYIKNSIGAGGKGGIEAATLAVKSGYWPLYSYDPRRESQGKPVFSIDSSEPDLEALDKFLDIQVRYNHLSRVNPEAAKRTREQLKKQILKRFKIYKTFSNIN